MTKSIIAFVLLLVALAPSVNAQVVFEVKPPATPPKEVLLAAIAAVETGNNPKVIGALGERSQFQIRPETWRRYSSIPHSAAAINPQESVRVALAFLCDIETKLKARGLPCTSFFVAAAWNAGPEARRFSTPTIRYAERVENLVHASLSNGVGGQHSVM